MYNRDYGGPEGKYKTFNQFLLESDADKKNPFLARAVDIVKQVAETYGIEIRK